MKLAIIMPVYLTDPLHQEFTQKTIDSIQTSHNYHLYIVVTHATPAFQKYLDDLGAHPHTTLISCAQGNILAAAWNQGIKAAAEAQHHPYLIINNDLIFHPQAIDNLLKFREAHPHLLMWTASEWADMRTLSQAKLTESHAPHPHFSCFLIDQRTIDTVGYFDEHFHMGYFEDNDYHIRLLLAGAQAAASDAAKFYHFGSRTINVDDQLRYQAKKHYEQNRIYLTKKWGVDLHGKAYDPPESVIQECFPTPFNDPSRTLKDW